MGKTNTKTSYSNQKLPLIMEKGADGYYVVECLLFDGCYTQGKTIDEALKNIKSVIKMIMKDKENKEVLKEYKPVEISLHTIAV